MMAETFESFSRLNKALPELSLNYDRIEENLRSVRENPSEAMVAILRGEGWNHSQYGPGHDFVKHIGKIAQAGKRKLIDVAMEDTEFKKLYDDKLSEDKREILGGKLELYTGHSVLLAEEVNTSYAREIASKN